MKKSYVSIQEIIRRKAEEYPMLKRRLGKLDELRENWEEQARLERELEVVEEELAQAGVQEAGTQGSEQEGPQMELRDADIGKDLEARINSLNAEQRHIFQEFMEAIDHQEFHRIQVFRRITFSIVYINFAGSGVSNWK